MFTVQRSYLVLALEINIAQVWYYLINDDNLYYPKAEPGPFFEVADSRLPDCWRFRPTANGGLFAFSEWVEDEYFLDRLTDGRNSELDIFEKYKAQMEHEQLLRSGNTSEEIWDGSRISKGDHPK